MNSRVRFMVSAALAGCMAAMSGCGGSSSSGGSGEGDSGNAGGEVLQGQFIDSAVQGLRYQAGNLSGLTDAAGTFSYRAGDNVQFFVGDVLLGTATGSSLIIPSDLVADAQDITDPHVINILRFLQSLDDDGNPDNGITITEPSANAALGQSVDFDVSVEAFTDSGAVQSLIASMTAVTSAGARGLISAQDAQDHATSSIQGLLAGTWAGTFSGDSTGTWSGTINAAGQFRGTATSDEGTEVFAGIVLGTGGADNFASSGGTSDGTTFRGTFTIEGDVIGTWNYFGEETGTWTGTRTSNATESAVQD